jgi:hypothetical protein
MAMAAGIRVSLRAPDFEINQIGGFDLVLKQNPSHYAL